MGQEAKQIKRQARLIYDYKLIVEINKAVANKKDSFMYLFNHTQSSDRLVRELAIIYFSHRYNKKLMTHIEAELLDETFNSIVNFIVKKMGKDLKSKLCSRVDTDKDFIKFIKKDTFNSGSLTGDVKIMTTIKKQLGKPGKKTNSKAQEKIDFILKNFYKKVPEVLDYVFIDEIKNNELDYLIMYYRRLEIIKKDWQSKKSLVLDQQIKQLVSKEYFEAYNIAYKSEKVSIF